MALELPPACRRRRCRPSPTAPWPSASRASTGCPSRRRCRPPRAPSCTPRSSGSSSSRPTSAPCPRPSPPSTRPSTPSATIPTSPASSSTPRPRPRFVDDAERLVRRYFELEDPTTITPIGLELKLEVEVGDLRLRGIIDRLELDDDGGLVVTDYKTGRVPRQSNEQGKLGGVHFYAFLCERLFGQRPARVQLLYLDEPVAIVTTPTEQSIRGLERKVTAIWTRGRAGLRGRGLPAQAVQAVRLVRVPGLLPRLRRQPRRRQGRRSRSRSITRVTDARRPTTTCPGRASAARPLGEAIEAAERVLPHPVEQLAERGPHELEPPARPRCRRPVRPRRRPGLRPPARQPGGRPAVLRRHRAG